MKKGTVILAQTAPLAPRMPLSRAPGPVRGGGEEAAYRASLRYRGLLQDYQELLKETEAKKRRLHMMKLMKQKLLAEVKFLRKRYISMSENPSQTVLCRVKNRSMPPPTIFAEEVHIHIPAAWAEDVEQRSVHAAGSSSKSLPVQRRHLGPPRASLVIDLNEDCEPSHKEQEFGFAEPRGINNVKRYQPLEGDVAAGQSGARMPIFWDVQDPAERTGKRKISYQDQLVLGV